MQKETLEHVPIFHQKHGLALWEESNLTSIQLFRKRLSEKVRAAIPKGIVGGFEFTVFQRNLIEWH